MHLVHEIIDLLSSSSPDLENALFKAQVLAHRLGERDMGAWVGHELKGYPTGESVPPYRVIPVTTLANFSNGFTRYTNHPLGTMQMDKRLRERLETRRVTESIAVIANRVKQGMDVAIVIAPEFYGHLKKGMDRR